MNVKIIHTSHSLTICVLTFFFLLNAANLVLREAVVEDVTTLAPESFTFAIFVSMCMFSVYACTEFLCSQKRSVEFLCILHLGSWSAPGSSSLAGISNLQQTSAWETARIFYHRVGWKEGGFMVQFPTQLRLGGFLGLNLFARAYFR